MVRSIVSGATHPSVMALFFPKLKRIKHEKLNKSPQEDYLGDPILSGDCVRCRMKFFGDLNI